MKALTRYIVMATVVAMCCFPTHVCAESFSDINRTIFERVTRPESIQQPVNPFAEGATTPEDLMVEDLQLMGVAIGHNITYALISGHIVEKGDFIAGFQVKSISSNSVVLKRLDEVYILRIGGGL